MKKILLAVLVLVLFCSSVWAIEMVRQKNVSTYIFFPIVDADGDFVSATTGKDSEIDTWNDGAAPDGFTDCTNECNEVGTSGWYYLGLSQSEMNYDYIAIQHKTTSAGAKTQAILIRTQVGDPLNFATTTDGVEILTGSDGLPTVNVDEWDDVDVASPTQGGVPIVDVQYYEGATDVDGNIQSEAADALTAYDPSTGTEIAATDAAIAVVDGIVDNVLLYTDGDGSDGIDAVIKEILDTLQVYDGTLLTVVDSLGQAVKDANKVNFMRWTAAEVGSVLNTVEDANKVNYMKWTTAQRDSILNTVEDANKVNFMRWTAAQVGSLLNTVEDANKVNYMRWTAAQVGSLLNTVEDANKANYKATGFATSGDGDSVIAAIADVNKANFKATGFATDADGDSVINAISDVNKTNFKYGAGADSVLAYLATEDEGRLLDLKDSVLLAINDVNKANFKYGGGADSVLAYLATHDSTLLEAAAAGGSGIGARTVAITILDDDDSTTAVDGFNVNVYDSSSGIRVGYLRTDSNGEAEFSLPDETYIVHLAKTPWTLASPRYYVVAADMDSTFYATAFDAGDPASADMCRIYINDVRDMGAIEQEDYELKAYIPEKYHPVTVGDAIRIPRITLATSDASGYVYLDVYRSTGLTAGDGTSTVLYDLELLDADGKQVVRRRNVEIPDAANWEIDWVAD